MTVETSPGDYEISVAGPMAWCDFSRVSVPEEWVPHPRSAGMDYDAVG